MDVNGAFFYNYHFLYLRYIIRGKNTYKPLLTFFCGWRKILLVSECSDAFSGKTKTFLKLLLLFAFLIILTSASFTLTSLYSSFFSTVLHLKLPPHNIFTLLISLKEKKMSGFYGVHQQHCDSQRSWLATNEKSFDHVLLPFETCTHTFLTYVCKVINLVSGLKWTHVEERWSISRAFICLNLTGKWKRTI